MALGIRSTSQAEQKIVQWNFDRTDVVAGAAQRGRLRQFARLFLPTEQWCQDGANWTTVDPAVGVPANLPVDGTDVLTGSTANAMQRLFEFATQQCAAPGIEQHDMHLLGTIGLAWPPRPARHRDVRGDLLARAMTRQKR